MSKEKVVLAYSGGLDTSVAIKWLQEKYDLEVIALTVDLGQPSDLKAVGERALKTGASEAYIVDAQKDFAYEFILPALKTNALYEKKYPLATALARPLIAKLLVDKAREVGAKKIAHGCTGKGNDQVRFEVAAASLNPNLDIIAPLREWKMNRLEEIEYARKHKIPVPVTKESSYSIDENFWGRSCECGVLEDPWIEPPADVFAWTEDPVKSLDRPEYIEIIFEKGIPLGLKVANKGQHLNLVDLIGHLNEIGGKHGIGRIDQVENRLVGIKSREIYEAPAATVLLEAHRELEALVLEKELFHYKQSIEQKYSELIYNGLWYSPLKQALDAFVEMSQLKVTGTVRIKLYKGSLKVVGRKSDFSLYDYALATYEEADEFSHQSAKGFIEIYSLSLRTWSRKQKGTERD